jgi:hypothetical protein
MGHIHNTFVHSAFLDAVQDFLIDQRRAPTTAWQQLEERFQTLLVEFANEVRTDTLREHGG